MRKVAIDIRRQTDSVTSIFIEIQSPSTRGIGALYLRQVFDELASAGAYLDDWGDEAKQGIRPGSGGEH